jgi:Tol biopolymer transport system component
MIGKMIGPFEVVSLLGKGGMGEVYRARDSKLNREVALKILPEVLAAQPDRLVRFQREAKVLAALQHQNIASIYGLEEYEGQPVLVMELAEGEELGDRIAASSLTGTEITKIARQLAQGLEYAHEQGVIHRDLKPANVKVFGDGQVKILDFGLARAMDPALSEESEGSTPFIPTVTQGLTVAGTVLGTAAYMSPEQARGYKLDRRSDIWSFGVILYEMLTGDRLFEGETATDTLAAILHKEPDFAALPEDASPMLIQICRRCLEKDPSNRLRDIGEVRVALEGSSSSVIGLTVLGAPAPDFPIAPAKPAILPWVVAGLCALALAATTFLGFTGRLGPAVPPPPLVHSSVSLPEGMQMNLNPAAPGPATLSPDGARLAFSAIDTNGRVMLYVRDLSDPVPRAIPGTIGAHYPFWAPDSRTVAFFAPNNRLVKVDVAGGPVITICEAENGKGGSWNEEDMVLFAPSHVSSIYMVSANGGEPVELTGLGQEKDYRSHRFPSWLPGSQSFLYIAISRNGTSSNMDSVLRLGTLEDPRGRDLMPCQTSATFGEGHILFVHDSILMARPFDQATGEFTDPAQPLLGGVLSIPAAHLAVISVSPEGLLAFSGGDRQDMGNSLLVQVDPESREETALGAPLLTYGFDISPDGTQVVMALPDSRNGTFDIWTLDIARNLRNRFTFDPETELSPLWGAQGQWIYFASDRTGVSSIFRRRVTGAGTSELIFEAQQDCFPTDLSSDGRLLAFTTSDSTGRFEMAFCDLSTGKTQPVHPGISYSEAGACFSPDVQWVAFMSNETSQVEVYVESMIPGGGRYRVSSEGGQHPKWSPDGRTLYYLAPSGEVRSVAVESSASGALRFGAEKTLTDRVEIADSGTIQVNPANGQVVVQRSTQTRQNSMLSLVTNWPHLLDSDD